MIGYRESGFQHIVFVINNHCCPVKSSIKRNIFNNYNKLQRKYGVPVLNANSVKSPFWLPFGDEEIE